MTSAVEHAAREFLRGIDERQPATVEAVLADGFTFLRPVREGNQQVGREVISGKEQFLSFLKRRFTTRPSDHRIRVWAENGDWGFAEGSVAYVEEELEIGMISSYRVDRCGVLEYCNTSLFALAP